MDKFYYRSLEKFYLKVGTSVTLLLLMCSVVLGQNVSGIVTDASSGEPLPGVNISVKGTTTGTSTDAEGKYSLDVPSLQDTLDFSFIGYKTNEVPVNGRLVIDIALQVQAVSGKELVVVGYGTQEKATLAGSVAAVGKETFEDLPISNPIAALQGTLPGTLVQRSSGRPGAEGYSINVRGFSSVNGTDNALVIIDGVPGDLSQVNPNDIKNATVLKDAAASIYGARAAGGVLLITTKEGKAGQKMQVGVNVSYSYKKPTGVFEQLNSAQVAEMDMEASKNAGSVPRWTDKLIDDIKEGNVHPVDFGGFTAFTGSWDYTDMTIGTGNQKNYDINLSGSSKVGNYRASIGYVKEEGVLNYGDDNNKRLNSQLNYDFNISDKLKIDTKLAFSRQVRQEPTFNSLWQINEMFPWLKPTVLGDNDQWATFQGYANPMQGLSEGGTRDHADNRVNANLKLDYNIIKGLTFTGQVGANYRFEKVRTFWRSFEQYEPVNGNMIGIYNNPNQGQEGDYNHIYSTEIGYLNYKKNFNNLHDISLTTGASHEKNKYRFFTATRTDFASNEFFSLNLGDAENQTNNGGGWDWAISSLFGRGSYVYDHKYILESNFRYDGSSRFAPETRWGFFWGASAGWRLSEENFIKNLGIFDNLKLRLSYGETGNQDGIGLYDYIQRINIGGAYPFGNGARIASASLGGLVDPNRTWETIQTKNIGLDYGFLKNRLAGSFDYFIKHNKDMLIPVTLPSVLGAAPPAGNNGELKAWGWEATLSWNDHLNEDWSYHIGFNLSDSENKVIDFGGQDTYNVGLIRVREGYPINTYHGYIADGIIKTQEELDAYKALPGVPGDIGIGDARYKDVNGDGKISVYSDDGSQGDVVPLGSSTPRYFYGVNLGIQFKGFTFSALLQGVGKKEMQIDGDWRMPWSHGWSKPDARWYHNTWSPERPNNPNPRLTHGSIRFWNYQYSDRTEVDASYIRLKNIRLAYNLPSPLLSRIGFQKATIYVVGFDIWEHQHLGGGFDVESLSPGQTDLTAYPYSKNYTVGVNLTF